MGSEEKAIVFCRGGGCTAKLGPQILSRVLEKLPKGVPDPNLLIGYDSHDDAAVYKVTEELAVVQTLDFFLRWWRIRTYSDRLRPPTP